MRESIIWIAELLFKLTDGVPLYNTPWGYVWFGIGVIVIAVISAKSMFCVSDPNLGGILGIVIMFFGLFYVSGPLLSQSQSVIECKTVEVPISTEEIGNSTTEVKMCRKQDNYYGEFGEWEIRKSKK